LGCTVEELGVRMSSEEFALHAAYWSREPTGPQGQMHLWASLMAAISNGALVRKDKQKFRASDFWTGTQWNPPPPPPPPGAKKQSLAPDFSAARGMKMRKVKR
jgi:hypothetical protein